MYLYRFSFPLEKDKDFLFKVANGKEKKVKSLSRVQHFVTPWMVGYQAPQSMGFSRQGYWSGLPFPSPGDLPKPGIKSRSPALQADSLPASRATAEAQEYWSG